MDFALSEEQLMIREMCRNFADEIIAPRAEELEKTGEYPYDIMSQMGELGMMGIPFAEEYGGGGGDWVSMALCIEEISRGDVGLGIMLDVTSMCAHEIESFGTEEQRSRWLPPLVKGKEIGSFALTEPDAGSDAASISCAATREGDQWVLNGAKQFITNIGLDSGSIAVVAAVSGRDSRGRGVIDSFIVPKDTPGFTIGRRYDKMGLHSSSTHELVFEDCRVPEENRLGEPGKGLAQHLATLQMGRIAIAACSVGLAQACLEAALAYARERIQFGQPIIEYQGVSFKLADMAVAVELARLMYLKAAWLKDRDLPYTFEASAAKLYASEMVERVASDAVQIHGGYGYMSDYPVSRYYRQAKVLQIVEGTSEVQRIVITRNL
ncbi:MAG: acyl-CoA dehydrogenase family protein [Chloroflexi bacterium]|nr:acyl-CoA dehydrogenase family protein [Chloroflexota bacterium]